MILCVLLLFLPQLLLGASDEYYQHVRMRYVLSLNFNIFSCLEQAILLCSLSKIVLASSKLTSESPKTVAQLDSANHTSMIYYLRTLNNVYFSLDIDHCHDLNVIPESVRSHLIRDVHRKHRPRALFVYVNSKTKRVRL